MHLAPKVSIVVQVMLQPMVVLLVVRERTPIQQPLRAQHALMVNLRWKEVRHVQTVQRDSIVVQTMMRQLVVFHAVQDNFRILQVLLLAQSVIQVNRL